MISARFISFRDLIANKEWPDSGCVKGHRIVRTKDYFFLSHRWLSLHHPDPEKEKWNVLKTWWDNLLQLKKLIRQIRPKELDSSARQELAGLRLQAAPLITNADNDDYNHWASGFLPLNPHWLDKDTAPAARAFLKWLEKTIDTVLDGYFWIDSYATSNASHRQQCEACHRIHQEAMASIPELVSDSMCIRLDGFASDEYSRGWINLELCIGHLYGTLLGKIDARQRNIEDALESIYALKYQTSDPGDGIVIPKLLGLAFAGAQLRDSFERDLYKDKDADRKFMKMVTSQVLSTTGQDVLTELELFLRFIRSEATIGRLPMMGLHAGEFLMYCSNWVIRGILGSAARARGVSLPASQQSLTTLQACIYTFVCRIRANSRTAAIGIIHYWQHKTKSTLVPELTTLAFNPDISQFIDRTRDYWSGDEGNLINIHSEDFLEP